MTTTEIYEKRIIIPNIEELTDEQEEELKEYLECFKVEYLIEKVWIQKV